MAANINGYEKLFIILKNKPNTMWVSRSPDKTKHVLAVRPRYVDERLGKVNLTGTADTNRNIVVEFNKPDLEIGFEVVNQFDGWVVVDMYHGNTTERAANIALRSGASYFFDNRNDIDKKRFSLKKKQTSSGSSILFSTSTPEENNTYRFVVKHVRRDEWPAKLELNFDDEIKIPYEEKKAGYLPVPLSIPTLYPELEFAVPKSLAATPAGTAWRSAAPLTLSAPSRAASPAYVAEQQLGSINTERLGNVQLDLDKENTTEFTFVTVLKD